MTDRAVPRHGADLTDPPELLVRGAIVIDGTGAPGVRAAVAVAAGRILAVGSGASGGPGPPVP